METGQTSLEKIQSNKGNNMKLNYDYYSYENILNNQKSKTIEPLMLNKESNNALLMPKSINMTLNSNLINQNYEKINNNNNEDKLNTFTEISMNKINNIKNIKNIKNINNKSKLKFDNEILNNNNNNEKSNDKLNNINYQYLQTTRNNFNPSSDLNLLKANLIENDFKNILKQKADIENKYLSLEPLKNIYINNNKNIQKKEEKKDFETLELIKNKNNDNKISNIQKKYLITDDDMSLYDDMNDKKNNKKIRNYKSNPHFNTCFDIDSLENSENSLTKPNKKNIKYKILQEKFDLLYKDNFILKTKYEIIKNNMKLLQKKLKQKNYDISQMKKVLLSNNQQINFLNTLKDSNHKSLKDNEELILYLKNTITNLNKKLIEKNNSKLNCLNIQNTLFSNDYNKIKEENESLKIYLNEKDNTISTLKNSVSFLTKNLDSLLNNSNNNANEKIITECEQKIKLLKEQMEQNLNKINTEKNQNFEEKMNAMKSECDKLSKLLDEKNIEIEQNKKYINEREIKEEELIKEIDELKKKLENKEKDLIQKTDKICDLNICLDKKKKELNDIQKILDLKNMEIEENKKKNDLQVISQSSFEFFRQVKNFEVDIKNKQNYINNNITTNDINMSDKFNSDNNFSNINNDNDDINNKNNNNKNIIEKMKNTNTDITNNKNHLSNESLFKDKKIYNNKNFKIKTNFDYFNYDDENAIKKEKSDKNLFNYNFRKSKSNKNINTTIGNSSHHNKSSNINMFKETKKPKAGKLKLYLLNENDEDINKLRYMKPNNKLRKATPNLILSTSTLSVSQNENINTVNYQENSDSNIEYIYSLMNSDIICFNLKKKKFELMKIYDNTKGIFTSYLSYYTQNKLKPLLLNTEKNFFILMQKHIFYYERNSNNISILTKTFSNHLNGKLIQIENSLYSISGNNNTQCEIYSLITKQNKLLPNTNYPRINSGICNVQNEYLYIFFGQFCDNSIERLNINNRNFDEKWEIINIKEMNGINNNIISLDKFITFLDDYNNVIIFGGEDYNKEKKNKNIYGFNLGNNSLSIIGKIDSNALYLNQHIQINDNIFSVFDINNGLHFFSKELDYHEIFNLNA